MYNISNVKHKNENFLRMAAHSLTAVQILDQLWAVRERELLQRVASGRELTMRVFFRFWEQFCPEWYGPEVQMEKTEKKTRKSSVLTRCKARVWNGVYGQCTRRGCKGPGNIFVGTHARCLADKGELPQGRIDGEVPENMLSSGDSSLRVWRRRRRREGGCLSGGVDELELEAALKILQENQSRLFLLKSFR